MASKGRGFAQIAGTRRHRKLSSKGGKAKVPKGFSTLSSEDRIVIAREASRVRWEKARRRKQGGSPINSQEDGRANETE